MDLTPQQTAFLQAYLDPKSETWGNALQSGIRSGYSQEYSESITYQMPGWLAENLGDNLLLQKALNNLNEFLSTDDKSLQTVKADLTKFTLKGLQKGKWSERKELGGIDGKDLIPSPESKEVVENAFKEI